MWRWMPCVLACIFVFWSCGRGTDLPVDPATLKYPNNLINKNDKVIIYDKTIPDTYRWLENITSNKVLDWAKSQNDISFSYLSSLSGRKKLSTQIQKLLHLETMYKASRDGKWYIVEKTDGESGRQYIYLYENEKEEPSLRLEPQAIEGSRNAAFGAYCISPDGNLMVFSLRNVHSGLERVFVLNLKTKKYVDKPIRVSPNTSLSWGPYGGFYYNKPFFSDNNIHIPNALFYHKAGTSVSEDVVVYYDEVSPNVYPWAFRTSDNRYLIVTAGNKDYTKVLYKPLVQEDGSPMNKLLELVGYRAVVVDNYFDSFYVLTNFDAPNGRVIQMDPGISDPGAWKTIIPESKDMKERVYSIGGKFYAKGKWNGDAIITAYDSAGKQVDEIVFPGAGVLDGPSGRPDYKDVLFSYRSFSQPSIVYKLTPSSNQIIPFLGAALDFDTSRYVREKIHALAKDGTPIPISLFYKKGLDLNGQNPMLIYSNGCLGMPVKSSFSAFRIPFIEAGGVFAIAHIRGGTELGEEWQNAAIGLNKKVSIFDLEACIQTLFDKKYSSPGKLAAGAEEGGGAILMGVVNNHPEWFKAVILRNGMFDLVNFERYNNAAIWRKDFGSVTDFKEFQNLMTISPLHNLKSDGAYPAFLLECDLTFKRVSPIHTFKMGATLQDNYGNKTPVLIRINQEATGNNKKQEVYEWTDRWAFLMSHLKMNTNRINLFNQ